MVDVIQTGSLVQEPMTGFAPAWTCLQDRCLSQSSHTGGAGWCQSGTRNTPSRFRFTMPGSLFEFQLASAGRHQRWETLRWDNQRWDNQRWDSQRWDRHISRWRGASGAAKRSPLSHFSGLPGNRTSSDSFENCRANPSHSQAVEQNIRDRDPDFRRNDISLPGVEPGPQPSQG